MNIRRLFTTILAGIMVLSMTAPCFAVETHKQSGHALKSYDSSSYSVVNNANMTMPLYDYQRANSESLNSTKGKEMNFRSHLYLSSVGVHNPQSIAVTPDGHYAYVMESWKNTAKEECNWIGRVYRIDLSAYFLNDESARLGNDYVKVGPKFAVGHGQAMAYNPKTKELWYVQKAKMKDSNLKRINLETLEPDKEISFRLRDNTRMGNTLAFDKDGNCYFYTRNLSSKWAPKNSIKIYKGTIGDTSVSFELVNQGIRYAPGAIGQSMGYDPRRNRLCIISDGGITTIPVEKLGNLSPEDVETTIFEGQKREFEGLSYDKRGIGYFITNRPYEIMWEINTVKKARSRIAKKKTEATVDRVMKGIDELTWQMGDFSRDYWESTGERIYRTYHVEIKGKKE